MEIFNWPDCRTGLRVAVLILTALQFDGTMTPIVILHAVNETEEKHKTVNGQMFTVHASGGKYI